MTGYARWVGADAFGLLGEWRRATRAAGWSEEDIDRAVLPAVAADYPALLRALAAFTDDQGADDECGQ